MITETPDGGIILSAPYSFKLTPFVVRELKAGVNWRGRRWCAAEKRWEITAQWRSVAERIVKHFYEDLPAIPPPPAHCPDARVYRVDGKARFIWQCGEMNDAQYTAFAKLASLKARRYNSTARAWSLPIMVFARFKRWLAADALFKINGYIVAGDAPALTRAAIIDAAYFEVYGDAPDTCDNHAQIARTIKALSSEGDREFVEAFVGYMPEKYQTAVRRAVRLAEIAALA